VILRLVELKLNVEALLDADLHLDLLVLLLLLLVVLAADVLHDEVLLLRHPVVLPIDADIDVVADAHVDPLIRLELLLHPIEREVVGHVVGQRAGRLQIANQLGEDRVVILVQLVLDEADELDADALVLQLLVFEQVHGELTADILAVHEDRGLERLPVSVGDRGTLAPLYFGQFDIYLAGRARANCAE